MKKSSYQTTFHIYLLFFFSLLGVLLVGAGIVFALLTVKAPNGQIMKSSWPKTAAENFKEQIIFSNGKPQVKQTGIEFLQKNKLGIQILSPAGDEVFCYPKPEQAPTAYSGAQLLALFQNGQLGEAQTTSFVGTVTHGNCDYVYILHFPVKIAKVTMYLNGDVFSGGKNLILPVAGIAFLTILVSGILYGVWAARGMGRLAVCMKEIAARSYQPAHGRGAFGGLYGSLNALDAEIRASDKLREQTETARKEWISNITHDLKTPLSPIKGYAELLQEEPNRTKEQCAGYAHIMLKNVAYMEMLIDDLKLTYQLENGMIPLRLQQQNLTRFLKELVIDLLNDPAYEHRVVHFEAGEETVLFSFDATLLKRAFQNLIINAFVHGDEATEVTLQIVVSNGLLQVCVSDNGKGMTTQETELLFERYYQGTSTQQQPQGTGLGLAITKNIVELHGGTISVSSIPGVGSSFLMEFFIN